MEFSTDALTCNQTQENQLLLPTYHPMIQSSAKSNEKKTTVKASDRQIEYKQSDAP